MPEVAPPFEAWKKQSESKAGGFGCLAIIALIVIVSAAKCGGSSSTSHTAASPSGTRASKSDSGGEAIASSTASPAVVKADLWKGIGKPIPGAAAYDATAGLEQRWGLHFNSKVIVEDRDSLQPGGMAKEAAMTDPDTGAELWSRVRTDNDDNVRVFECSVTGDLSPAADLLGFCATLPYDGAQPIDARAWVVRMLPKVRQGHPLTKKFGGVQLEVMGTTPAAGFGMRALEITMPA